MLLTECFALKITIDPKEKPSADVTLNEEETITGRIKHISESLETMECLVQVTYDWSALQLDLILVL
jgi:hypothetical protein